MEISESLVNDYDLVASRGVSTMEALAMFLWACGGPQTFQKIRNKFGYSLETISRKFSEVLNSVYRMSNNVIKPKDANFTDIHPRLWRPNFGHTLRIA